MLSTTMSAAVAQLARRRLRTPRRRAPSARGRRRRGTRRGRSCRRPRRARASARPRRAAAARPCPCSRRSAASPRAPCVRSARRTRPRRNRAGDQLELAERLQPRSRGRGSGTRRTGPCRSVCSGGHGASARTRACVARHFSASGWSSSPCEPTITTPVDADPGADVVARPAADDADEAVAARRAARARRVSPAAASRPPAGGRSARAPRRSRGRAPPSSGAAVRRSSRSVCRRGHGLSIGPCRC